MGIFEALDRNRAWRVFRHAKAIGDILSYFGWIAWAVSGAAITAGITVTWLATLPIWGKVIVGLLVILLILLVTLVFKLLRSQDSPDQAGMSVEVSAKKGAWINNTASGLLILAALILAAVMSTKPHAAKPDPPSIPPYQPASQSIPAPPSPAPISPEVGKPKTGTKTVGPRKATSDPAKPSTPPVTQPVIPSIPPGSNVDSPCGIAANNNSGQITGGNCGAPPAKVKITPQGGDPVIFPLDNGRVEYGYFFVIDVSESPIPVLLIRATGGSYQ